MTGRWPGGRRLGVAGFFLVAAGFVRAGEVSLAWMPGALLEYEGTGYRQHPQGWELKVKPRGPAGLLRWRQGLGDRADLRLSYLRNAAFFAEEDGNAAGAVERQTGQTELTLDRATAGLGYPLTGEGLRVLGGLEGVRQRFVRRAVVNDGVLDPGVHEETLAGLGAYLGFGGGRAGPGFYWDWEATMTHFFKTWNQRSVEGGAVTSRGFGYALRLEAGWRRGSWGVGLGYFRALANLSVPGGETLPNGAAVSLPLNKTDVLAPYLAVTYAY